VRSSAKWCEVCELLFSLDGELARLECSGRHLLFHRDVRLTGLDVARVPGKRSETRILVRIHENSLLREREV
jgi:hypothetical protein